MPKVPNSRKFLKSVRQSASPLASTNGPDVAAAAAAVVSNFSLADHQQFSDMKSGELLEVIKSRLRHQLPAERCVGTDMISTFLTTKRLAQFKQSQIGEIVKLLAILLLDRAENVRYGAIDALCYLSSLSDECCDLLVSSDILRQLMPMFELYFLTIDSWSQPKVTDRKLTLNLYVDCFNLLTNLCGVSSQFVETLLSHTKISEILRKSFQTLLEPCEKTSFVPIAIATAQCLSVICEDERVYARFVHSGDSGSNLSDVFAHIANLDLSTTTEPSQTAALLYLKSLIISIASAHQFKSPEVSPIKEELLTKLSQVWDHVFSVEANQSLGVLFTQLHDRVKQDLSSELRNLHEMIPLYDQIKYRYLIKRNCMELLTNLLVSDEDEEGEGGDFEEMADGEDEDMELMDSAEQNATASNICDPLVLQFCKDKNILQVWVAEFAALNSIPEEALQTLSGHVYGKDIVATMQSTKISTMTLISNLISSKLIPSNDQTTLAPIWQIVHDVAFKEVGSGEPDEVLLELVIEIREEAINIVREFLSCSEVKLTTEELEALYTFGQKNCSRISNFTKINIFRVLAFSLTAAYRAQADQPPSVMACTFVEKITGLLLDGYRTTGGMENLVLRAEILDALMDAYSDDNQLGEFVMAKMKMVEALKEISAQFKNEMKCNPLVVRQNAVISTVGLNLNRFIKYKQKKIRQRNFELSN